MSNTPLRDGGGYAAVDGLEMYYEIRGAGDPLVMLHGGLSTVSELQRIVPALAERRRVIAVERQGHGGLRTSNGHSASNRGRTTRPPSCTS